MSEWTDELDTRRCDLIELEITGTSSPRESLQLQDLRHAMWNYRREVALLPIEDARKFHRELLSELANEGLSK